MSGPTPGPWKVVRYTGEVTVEAPCGRVIYFAAVQSDENAVDDAHLIAAAHDLLEALESSSEWIKEAINSGCRLPADNTLRKNLAAIAKARGEA